MNLINLKIQQLKDKKNQIKDQRKQINTTYNDPTETDRELVDIDNQINNEKIAEIERHRIERQKKKELQKEQVFNETRELITETFKVLRRIGIIRNSNEMGKIMGGGFSYFRLYENKFINGIKISSLNDLKENIYSLKTGLNILIENDPHLPPKDWIYNKLDFIIGKLDKIIYKLIELEVRN